MKLHEDRVYTKEMLWLKEENGEIVIGIVEPAVEKAKEFAFVELPEPGEKLVEGDSVAEYEAMKRVGELETPFKAEVVKKNQAIEEQPGKLNEDPYRAWMVKTDTSGFNKEDYMSAEQAKQYYSEEIE